MANKNSLAWCVIKLRSKKTGNQIYDFAQYKDIDTLRQKSNVVILASFSDYDTCIEKLIEIESKNSGETFEDNEAAPVNEVTEVQYAPKVYANQYEIMVLERKLFDLTIAMRDANEKFVLFADAEIKEFYDIVEKLDNRLKNAR
jgi:hypothetical protein